MRKIAGQGLSTENNFLQSPTACKRRRKGKNKAFYDNCNLLHFSEPNSHRVGRCGESRQLPFPRHLHEQSRKFGSKNCALLGYSSPKNLTSIYLRLDSAISGQSNTFLRLSPNTVHYFFLCAWRMYFKGAPIIFSERETELFFRQN